MSKVIDLDAIIEKMYKEFPESSLSEIEKAKYLYIQLGKKLKYDINYETNYNIKLEETYYKSVDLNNIKDDTYTCPQISRMYAEILRRVGIKAQAKLRSDYELDHQYTVITLRDGKKLKTDLTQDLAYIQKGMRIQYFGAGYEELESKEYDNISQDENEQIDIKIGYAITFKNFPAVYMEKVIELMKKEFENEELTTDYIKKYFSEEESKRYEPSNLVKYKFDAISRFLKIDEMGFREGDNFLKYVYNTFFTESERKNIRKYKLYTEHEEGFRIGETENLRCYVYKDLSGKKVYYLYEVGRNLRKISIEELAKKVAEINLKLKKMILERDYLNKAFNILYT